MEEVLLRFGHLGKQIFNNLDIQSLKNCGEFSQPGNILSVVKSFYPFKSSNFTAVCLMPL